MAARTACTPWLINVARRAGLAGVDQLTADPQASLDDSWASVQATCGVNDADVTQHIAKYFRMGVADFKSAQPQAIKLLQKEGYRTSEAADGVEAIQKLSALPVSLVVLDLTMPKLSGEEELEKEARDVLGALNSLSIEN
jgi:hypothetical protein